MLNLVERIAMTAMNGVLPSPARIKRSVIGYSIIGLLLLTAYGAVIVGGSLYVAQEAGPIAAAFLVAAVAIASAMVAMAVMSYLDRRARIEAMLRQQQAGAMRSQMLGTFQGQVLGTLHPLLPLMIRQSPIASAVIVASLAYAIARSKGVGRKPK